MGILSPRRAGMAKGNVAAFTPQTLRHLARAPEPRADSRAFGPAANRDEGTAQVEAV